MTIIISLLVANAIAHIISFLPLNKVKSPDRYGVLAFVFINAIIAILLWEGISWAKWLALVFPAVGGIGLFITTLAKGNGTWIDYIILVLDILLIGFGVKTFLM